MIHPQIRSNLNGVNCKCTLYFLYIHIEGSLAKQMKELTDIYIYEYINICITQCIYIEKQTYVHRLYMFNKNDSLSLIYM